MADPTPEKDEMSRLMGALSDSLTDSMVERLAGTAGESLAVLDRLNDEETRDAVHALIDGLTDLHKVGALDTLMQLALLVHGMRNALTDSMVERLAGFVERMADTLDSEDLGRLTQDAARALEDSTEQIKDAPPAKGGLLPLLTMLSKPETQESLRFLLAYATAFRTRATQQD